MGKLGGECDRCQGNRNAQMAMFSKDKSRCGGWWGREGVSTDTSQKSQWDSFDIQLQHNFMLEY